MKKYIIAGTVLCILAASCRKDNDGSVFGLKPEERMNATLTAYKQQLTSGASGWKAYLFPDGGQGFGFYFKFGENNRVNMLGDLTPATGQDLSESSYRMGAQQRPSLVFDTYNYLHLLSDPDERVFGGLRGKGYGSDFEFGYDSTRTDTVFLTGNAQKSKMILVRASAAEEAAYKAGGLNIIRDAVTGYVSTHATLYTTTADGKKVQTVVNPNTRGFSLVYEKDGELTTEANSYAYTLSGLFTKNPFTINNNSYRELLFDTDKQVMYLKGNGKNTALEVANGPIFALHLLMGIGYNSIQTSDATQGAFSPGYKTMWTTAKTRMPNLGFPNLQLVGLNIIFDAEAKLMGVQIRLTQNANSFTGIYIFDYAKNKNGEYSFTMQDIKGEIPGLVYPAMKQILDKLATGKYRVDYFSMPGNPQMAQLISVDDPTITIGGSLK
ncbi:DUF4302 domain-containing protein [Chitinophaga varians]|uniref:DUF4302 domain-containing protein n=1 Tax=Chitinophaga varians TaxID=2202339 RepID=UPI00165F58F0|nr:DUF4302 domain-containing protein [Chitinophaga varians]MBC9912637.1 DUF4302 domain-containing protein [Chitinophaga varians]